MIRLAFGCTIFARGLVISITPHYPNIPSILPFLKVIRRSSICELLGVVWFSLQLAVPPRSYWRLSKAVKKSTKSPRKFLASSSLTGRSRCCSKYALASATRAAENIPRLETRRLPKLGDMSCIPEDTVTKGSGGGSTGFGSSSESNGGGATTSATTGGGGGELAPGSLRRRRRLMARPRKLGVALSTDE